MFLRIYIEHVQDVEKKIGHGIKLLLFCYIFAKQDILSTTKKWFVF